MTALALPIQTENTRTMGMVLSLRHELKRKLEHIGSEMLELAIELVSASVHQSSKRQRSHSDEGSLTRSHSSFNHNLSHSSVSTNALRRMRRRAKRALTSDLVIREVQHEARKAPDIFELHQVTPTSTYQHGVLSAIKADCVPAIQCSAESAPEVCSEAETPMTTPIPFNFSSGAEAVGSYLASSLAQPGGVSTSYLQTLLQPRQASVQVVSMEDEQISMSKSRQSTPCYAEVLSKDSSLESPLAVSALQAETTDHKTAAQRPASFKNVKKTAAHESPARLGMEHQLRSDCLIPHNSISLVEANRREAVTQCYAAVLQALRKEASTDTSEKISIHSLLC
eukprot:3122640-Rhodomonas_salina.1